MFRHLPKTVVRFGIGELVRLLLGCLPPALIRIRIERKHGFAAPCWELAAPPISESAAKLRSI